MIAMEFNPGPQLENIDRPPGIHLRLGHGKAGQPLTGIGMHLDQGLLHDGGADVGLCAPPFVGIIARGHAGLGQPQRASLDRCAGLLRKTHGRRQQHAGTKLPAKGQNLSA